MQLNAALHALEAATLAQLGETLAAHSSHGADDDRLRSLLALLPHLGPLLASASAAEFATVYRSALRVVKQLCRLAIRHAAAVAGDPDNATRFLLLDDVLCSLLGPVAAFAERVAASPTDDLIDDSELARWVPLAVCASCFARCKALPALANTQSSETANRVISACCSALQVDSEALALRQFLSQVSALCSQGMAKDQWTNPHSIHKLVLLHVVQQVPAPHIGGDVLGRLLALTLPLVDDLRDETQYVGAQLLRHLVGCATPTELRWYRDALLETLRVALTTRKPATLGLLLDCLAETLAKVSPPGEVRYYDRFLPRLLTDTSLASNVEVRAALVKGFRPIVERMGAPHSLHLIRYLQPLLKVLAASFDSIDVDLLVETLKTLRATIVGAWPRVAGHVELIMVAVLRAVAFCELFDDDGAFTASPEHKKRLLPLCEDVIGLLIDVDSHRVLDMLRTVGDESAGLKPFADRLLNRNESTTTAPP